MPRRPFLPLLRGLGLGFLIWATRAVGITAEEESFSLESSCRAAGFDPYQLACSTCHLLPDAVQETCGSCCLSYKTLEKRTQRYQGAVLIHPNGSNGMSFFPQVDNMIEEDWKDLVALKGSKKLMLKDSSSQPMFPSTLLWFKDNENFPLPTQVKSMTVSDLSRRAAETVVLEGWKRDDLREMLKAILPDQ